MQRWIVFCYCRRPQSTGGVWKDNLTQTQKVEQTIETRGDSTGLQLDRLSAESRADLRRILEREMERAEPDDPEQ